MTTANATALFAKKKRQSNIELLRIIAMALIILSHFGTHGGFNYPATELSVPRLWVNLIKIGGPFGVDIFVLISGYFLIKNESRMIAPKKTAVLWGQIFFYTVVIFVIFQVFAPVKITIKSILSVFFPVVFGNKWWFATTYFILFLIHPFLNKALNAMSKLQYQIYLAVIILIWCIIPTFTKQSLQSNNLIAFVMFYSIAGYIRLHGTSHKKGVLKPLCIGIGFYLITYASNVAVLLVAQKIPKVADYAFFFYDRTELFILFSAICIFTAFTRINMRYSKFINLISSATFGIYLIHEHPQIREFLWLRLFHNASFQNSAVIIPYSLFALISIFTVCMLIDWCRKYTLEKGYLFVIDKVFPILSKPCHKIFDKIVIICETI